MEEKIDITPIKLSDIERMTQSIRRDVGENDVDISFEFMLTAFFPTCWNNIQKALTQQYTLGFIAGTKEKETIVDTINDDADCFCD